MYSPVPKFFVSSRSDVGLLAFGVSKFAGLAVRGEEFSMAAAYALERVLKAVGEVRSIPALSAVDDFPNVNAVVGVLIWRDSRGRLGGEEDSGWKDIVTVGEQVLIEASIIEIAKIPKIWRDVLRDGQSLYLRLLVGSGWTSDSTRIIVTFVKPSGRRMVKITDKERVKEGSNRSPTDGVHTLM
jgi:hypothetical protein